MSQATSRRRWWRFIGPWQLFPTAVALTLWLSSSFFELARLTGTRTAPNWDELPGAFVPTLIPAALAWLYLDFVRRRFAYVSRTLPRYLLALLGLVVVFVIARFALGQLPTEALNSTGAVIGTGLLRTAITVLFIQTAVGISSRRMQDQIEATEAALALAREQQEQLVDADERVRSQVAQLLHDRVQAGLIAACLELQEFVETRESDDAEEIRPIITRLEQLRSLDVRAAARALSPDLVDIDLHSALEELARQYGSSMQVDIHVDREITRRDTRPPQPMLLGCYRIIEQALLNAAVHGHARQCSVSVTSSDDTITVTITDDGDGLHTEVTPGIGTLMTTTWIRILNGSWSRSSGLNRGAVVSAWIPAHS